MKQEFIEAGEIVTTHGVRGEVKVNPFVDSAAFLAPYTRVRIAGRTYPVVSCRVQKSCALLRLAGVDSLEAAQALRGKTVEIFRADVPEGVVFACELLGMQVYSGDTPVGQITDVLDYPGNSVYVVTGQREYFLPAVKEFILSIDLEGNRMQVRLLEGMGSDED